ncbi:MAG: (2Fe-2S)-binding protein [Planctomycetes bacterium]|nr:(2Fe-2S)-binding protein [Planctomycetota bacterium]
MTNSNGSGARSLSINGVEFAFQPGETVLQVAQRNGIEIPTLCHDPRLKPAGACRTCLVEIEGGRRMMPSCATAAEAGARITTESARIDRHRKSLLSLYLTDHVDREHADGRKSDNQLLEMAHQVGASTDWPRMENRRPGRPGDRNPYIDFDPEACILCARCTRYCDEVESVSAITLANRASETTISTSDGRSLLDTSCELCGGCIDTCPTGAMTEKRPIQRQEKHERELRKVRSTCNFCGVGCQLDLNVDPDARDGAGQVIKVTSPEPGSTTNDGNLCVKGRFAYDFIHHGDRLTHPLVRGENGELRKATWEEALERTAQGLLGIREKHGADALAFISSSRCTVEENYLVQKIARAAIGTHNVHQCAAT